MTSVKEWPGVPCAGHVKGVAVHCQGKSMSPTVLDSIDSFRQSRWLLGVQVSSPCLCVCPAPGRSRGQPLALCLLHASTCLKQLCELVPSRCQVATGFGIVVGIQCQFGLPFATQTIGVVVLPAKAAVATCRTPRAALPAVRPLQAFTAPA